MSMTNCTHACPYVLQVWQPEELMGLDLQHMQCVECGSGDDDAHLLICDGEAAITTFV